MKILNIPIDETVYPGEFDGDDIENIIHSNPDNWYNVVYRKVSGIEEVYVVRAHPHDRKPWEISVEDEFGARKGFKRDGIRAITNLGKR